MRTARDELEAYPLAKVYGWNAPKMDHGGILFLFPPTATRKTGQYDTANRTDRLEAIHPHDLTLSAREATEFQYSRIPFRQKRLRHGQIKNGATGKGKASDGGRINGRAVVPKETREEQSAR